MPPIFPLMWEFTVLAKIFRSILKYLGRRLRIHSPGRRLVKGAPVGGTTGGRGAVVQVRSQTNLLLITAFHNQGPT